MQSKPCLLFHPKLWCFEQTHPESNEAEKLSYSTFPPWDTPEYPHNTLFRGGRGNHGLEVNCDCVTREIRSFIPPGTVLEFGKKRGVDGFYFTATCGFVSLGDTFFRKRLWFHSGNRNSWERSRTWWSKRERTFCINITARRGLGWKFFFQAVSVQHPRSCDIKFILYVG